MLPDQIGDGLHTQRFQVGARPQPIDNASGAHENVVKVLIQAGRGNSEAGIIYVGDARVQAWQLTRGESMPPIPISRASAIYFYGDATAVTAGDVIQVVIVTTTGRRRESTGP